MRMTTKRLSVFTVFGISAALLFSHTASARVDCERQHLGNRVATVEELIDCLSPSSATRGLRVAPQGETAATEVAPPVASLRVSFEFGSYALTSESEAQLDKVGQALKSSSLRGDLFLIEGHTDGVGTGDYNRTLSENRANAAKQYLVEVAGIEPGRLQSVGRGEQQLLEPENPQSRANRRVQIVNLREAN